MRLKKILMLFIFIFSLMMTNLFNSHNKPPLLEHRATQNIVILAENNSNPQEIIPLDLSSGDNHNFIVDYYKDMIPLLIEMVLAILTIYVVKEKFFRYRKERGLAGIILWDKKRVLRN